MESIMQSSSSSSSSVNNGSSATNNNIHIQSTRRFSFQAHAAAVQQPPEAAVAWNSRWAQQQRQRQDHQHDGERNFALLSNGVDFRTLQSTPMHSPSSAQRPNSLELVGDSRQTFVWTRIFSHLSSSPSSNEIANQPPPRSGAASVVVCGRLYIFGGYGGGTGRLDDFYCFHFESQTWETVRVLSAEKPGCRENNGVVIADDTNKSIYLFGGYDGQSWLNDLWKFDIDTERWTCLQESTSFSDSHGNGLHDGGNNASLESTSNTFNGETEISGAWNTDRPSTFVGGCFPSRRFGYVSVVHDGRFIVWGGFDGSRWLNDMYVYTFATRTWTQVMQPPSSLDGSGAVVWPSVRSCPAWAKDDKCVYIQGGYDGIERKSDFFALDLTNYTWKEMPSWGSPPSPRYFHSCGIHGHKLYLYGGYSGSERLSDLHAYDFETQHWSRIDARGGDIPSGRSSLVLQVFESHLYVFGGYNGSTVLNDFFKFRLKPINVPATSLVQDLSRLIQNPELSDVAFLVEDKVVFANKAILAIRSDYFRVMLCGGMREASSSEHPLDAASPNGCSDVDSVSSEKKPSVSGIASTRDDHRLTGEEIPLPEVPYPVFLRVLEFIYTDTLSIRGDEFPLELGIQLLIASELFMLDRLKALCEDLIRREIYLDNVVEILVAAYRHNAVGLKDLCLEFILLNISNPTLMDGLSELKSEPDLLLEIIKRSTFITNPNYRVSMMMDNGNGSGSSNAVHLRRSSSASMQHRRQPQQHRTSDGAYVAQEHHHDVYYLSGAGTDGRIFVPSCSASSTTSNHNIDSGHSRSHLASTGGIQQQLGDDSGGGLADNN